MNRIFNYKSTFSHFQNTPIFQKVQQIKNAQRWAVLKINQNLFKFILLPVLG
jgi:hypothetical protein